LQTAQERHFIFGYGSLINSISRTVTGETGVATAVKISGISRHWSRISEDFGMSSVVVVENIEGQCNGVIVEVPESELVHFDKRERGYQRVLVDANNVEFYDQGGSINLQSSGNTNIWLYQSDKVVNPCDNHPVVFSYLDVILSGCLEYSEAFCNDFIEHTQGWQHAMLNDRDMPRYPRVQPALDTGTLNYYISQKSPLTADQIVAGY
jgi:hypothetical protein